MTAEIAIMNKEAVALAADSAVTLQVAGLQKVSTSANKIFKLSMKCPVGIMFHGNALFMGLPWETLIKAYRASRDGKKFDSIEEYGKDFINYLISNDIEFDEAVEELYIRSFAGSSFLEIQDNIERRFSKWIKQGNKINKTIVRKFAQVEIIQCYDYFRENNDEFIPIGLSRRIIKGHWDVIEDIMEAIFRENAVAKIFQEDILTKKLRGKLKQIIINMFSKRMSKDIQSGIVIAGFGEKEFTPSLSQFIIEGMIDKRLKYKEEEVSSVSEKNSAIISALAQREMTVRFMEGVDPLYREYENEYLNELCRDYAEKVVGNISGYTAQQKRTFKQTLIDYGVEVQKEFNDKMQEFIQEQFVAPILTTVSGIPKTEIAAMAEALVHLTSIKRKVSLQEETVAGPIDVAIISKDDGFIWIKRKHYFEKELNPQFFTRYKEGEGE